MVQKLSKLLFSYIISFVPAEHDIILYNKFSFYIICVIPRENPLIDVQYRTTQNADRTLYAPIKQ